MDGRKNNKGNPQNLTSEGREKGLATIRDRPKPELKLQVSDMAHAQSEEVLQFCMSELEKGTTYNDLRVMLGLGPAAHDERWRMIRELLVEMILPDSEEDALRTDAALSGFMLQRIEKFMTRVMARADDNKGEESEPQFLKLELEAMKLLLEKYNKRTDHYLKMKDIQKKEKRTSGTTIIFNNLHAVARPGDVTMKEAAKLVTQKKKADGLE